MAFIIIVYSRRRLCLLDTWNILYCRSMVHWRDPYCVFILYPILNFIIRKNWACSLFALFVMYEIIRINKRWFEIPIDVNPIICILSFCVGMALSTCKKHILNRLVFCASIILNGVLILIPFGYSHNTKELLLGWLLLILLLNIGHCINSNRVNHFLAILSGASYPVILIHLPIIHKVTTGWNTTKVGWAFIILTTMFMVLYLLGSAINIVLKKIYSMKVFTRLDTVFEGNKEILT